MKKILFFFALFSVSVQFAQGQKQDTIKLNFDKVIHIVLPFEVDFVQAGSTEIEAVKVNEKPNIVKVVAIEENFTATTNVTIIDKGGNIYSFPVLYTQNSKEIKSIFYIAHTGKEDKKAVLNKSNKAFLIFPDEVVYFVSGGEFITVEKVSAKNILSVGILADVSAPDEFETNVFAVCKNGAEYNVILNNGEASNYLFYIDKNNSEKQTAVAKVETNTETLQAKLEKLSSKSQRIFNMGVSKNKLIFSITNIFVDDKYLYFAVSMDNSSSINYSIDFIKTYLVDKKTTKNAVQQEKVVEPVPDGIQKPTLIEGKSTVKTILVYDKFTIPDDKVFRIEIFEKNGGRHIMYDMNNKDIINAEVL